MKKNRMMRLASVLLVAVLMTTCTISGTFAKYVTQATGSDTARVAKWGVQISSTGKTFAEAYDNENDKVASTVVSANYDLGVDGSEDNVVAPGTSGTMAHFVVTGRPEVDVRISYGVTFEIGDNWKVDADNNNVNDPGYVRDTFYCPIVITITDNTTGTPNTTVISGLDQPDAPTFESAVKTAIESIAVVYQANTDLSTVNDDLTIEWAWAFDSTSLGGVAANDDEYDTQLGDVAAFLVAPTIMLEVTCTATQLN